MAELGATLPEAPSLVRCLEDGFSVGESAVITSEGEAEFARESVGGSEFDSFESLQDS